MCDPCEWILRGEMKLLKSDLGEKVVIRMKVWGIHELISMYWGMEDGDDDMWWMNTCFALDQFLKKINLTHVSLFMYVLWILCGWWIDAVIVVAKKSWLAISFPSSFQIFQFALFVSFYIQSELWILCAFWIKKFLFMILFGKIKLEEFQFV